MIRPEYIERERTYRINISVSIIAAQLVFILMFNYWPRFEPRAPVFNSAGEHTIQLDMIEITEQKNAAPPPPPPPQVPVPRPDDVIFEDVIDMDDSDNELLSDLKYLYFQEFERAEKIHNNPQRPPNVIRIVEPVFPAAARTANIRAEIVVTFVINQNGEVEEVSIFEIRLLNEDNEYEIIQSIDYGLVDATLNAAMRWRFRPAENNGEKVRSLSRHIFSYGI